MLDSLTADDIAGARSLYGAGERDLEHQPSRRATSRMISSAQLIALYRDRLGAASVTTFVDPEGAVVWLSEYARYRVGLVRSQAPHRRACSRSSTAA